MIWLLLASSLSCKKPPAVVEPVVIRVGAQAQRAAIIGPARWSDPGGLCLDLPEGWQGSVGPAPRVLDITHPEGLGFTVFLDEAQTPGEPLATQGAKPGFALVYYDEDSMRSVPALTPAATWTWLSDAPNGPLIKGWGGVVHGHPVRLEITYPYGRVTALEPLSDELLRRLCVSPDAG